MTNINELMMDALDGTITPANRTLLDAHLAQHPDARIAFEHMMRIEAALRETPAVAAPAGFTGNVMAQARALPIAQPMHKTQIAAIIAANSVLVGVVWAMMAALLVGLGVLAAQTPALQPVFAFIRGIATFTREGFELFATATRAWSAQPLAWVTLLAALALVGAWVTVMAKVLRPQYAR
jgi:anti-sigma factor RsiW